MKKVIYTNGKIELVENNDAHYLIEKGLAKLYKEVEKPQKDKMISKQRKVKTK